MAGNSKPLNCAICDKAFGILRWRHDCSGVGCKKIVCSKCTDEIQLPEQIKAGNFEQVQLCKECHAVAAQVIHEDPILRASKASYDKGFKEGYDKGFRKGRDTEGLKRDLDDIK